MSCAFFNLLSSPKFKNHEKPLRNRSSARNALTDDLEVDFKGLKKLLNHTAKGVDYYVVMGTTGESPTVDSDEKKAILDFVKKHNPKGLPIVYGIGGNSTQGVIEEIRETDLN